ncbi:BRO family protein [Mycolicibacterium conceptionense]|uniref:BRO family protein n=1 Tax=Mycolicibacterium conceptionense TaxID=451644 RepID=UPI00069F43E3|nr:BRO family protein [Mycolicibacterium conceptionense]
MARKPFFAEPAHIVGPRVRNIRIAKGMTIPEVCRAGNLRSSQVYGIESGKAAVGKVLAAKLSTALGVDPAEFGVLTDPVIAPVARPVPPPVPYAGAQAPSSAVPDPGSSSSPSVFIYNSMSIRTTTYRGRRMAVAADICRVLEIANVADTVSRLEPEDVATIRRSEGVGSTDTFWSQFPYTVQSITLVTEDGATDLVLDSRKPEARKFRKWLTHEVWPAIRDTGSYSAPAVQPPGTYIKTGDPETDLHLLRDAVESLIIARRDAREAVAIAERTEARLDAIEGKHDWFSALAYARLHKLQTGAQWLAGFGRMATTVARGFGIAPDKVQHAHFGEVNSYPEWVWDDALPKWLAATEA